MASNQKLFRDDGSVMMSAHALCPSHLSHPEKMRWMAEYFREHSPAAQPVASEEQKVLSTLIETFRDSLHRGKQPTFSKGDLVHFINALIPVIAQPVAVDWMPERKDEDSYSEDYARWAKGYNECLDAVSPLVAGLRAENSELRKLLAVRVEASRLDEVTSERDAQRAEVERLRALVDQGFKAMDRTNAMWRRNFEKATGGPYPIPALSADEEFHQLALETATLRTTNAELVGLLREVRPACYEEYHAVIDALLASTGGGERG